MENVAICEEKGDIVMLTINKLVSFTASSFTALLQGFSLSEHLL